MVVGNVCRKDHIEVLAAQERKLPLTSFPALLSELFLPQRRSVVVAGTHGKTTTSSIMAHALAEAGRDPSFLIGGVPLNFRQSWRLGEGEEFVVEGDEYDTAFFDKKSKFLHYRPQIVILTSVEFDHADIFRRRGGGEGGVPGVHRADPRRRRPRSCAPPRRARWTWPRRPAAG